MAIKFGDTLENQNSDYPIVDVNGNNVAGIHFISTFSNAQLGAVPTAARREGSIVIAQDTQKLYVFGSSNVADGSGWNDTTSASWVEQSGNNTLGSDESFTNTTLQDNSPALTDFTTATTITSAIDRLNETLGSLVPAAPTSWDTYENNLTESLFGVQTTNNARLVPLTGAGSVINHNTNNSDGTYTSGSGSNTVKWETDTSINAEINVQNNNLAQTQLSFGINNETATLASATATSAQVTGAANNYGGQIDLVITTGDYPNSGDSQGFYTGVNKIEMDIAATITSGFHTLFIEDQSGNGVRHTIYRASSSTSASIVATGQITDAGDNVYMSGQKYWTRPTYKPSLIQVSDIIPNLGWVYGASSDPTDNDFLTFTAGTVFPAFAAKAYTDIDGITSVDDLKQNQTASFDDTDFSSVTAVTGISGWRDLGLSTNTDVPRANANSIHGGDTDRVEIAGQSGNDYAFWDKNNIAQSSTALYPYEDNLYTNLHSTDDEGERVKDPDVGGTYVDTPSDAVSAYTLWSPQYGNGSASLSIDEQDAITAMDANGNLQCAHETRNFTSGYNFAGSAQNFSGRTTGTPQFVTYRFPINGTSVSQITLKFEGDLDGGGDVWVKIFDGSTSDTLAGANSATGGWVAATANGVNNSDSIPVGGCANGTPLSTTSTSLQTVNLNAGGARWENGSDNYIYVRVKMYNGDYVRKIALVS